MKSKNYDVQVFKFLYSCIIVVYHLASSTVIKCPGGYYGVEYFLLTSGLFLFLSWDKKRGTESLLTPGQYLSRRFWRFLPWSITGFVFAVIVQRGIVEQTTSFSAWISKFPSDLLEVLMVKGTGVNAGRLLINGPAWTISSLLIIGFLFWTFLYHWEKPFIHIIMPLTVVIGFGVWANLSSADTNGYIGFTMFGTFRTWLIFCMSYYCMLLCKKMSQMRLNRKGKWLLTIMEVLIHAIALYYVFTSADRSTQWVLMGLFMVSIAIAVSGHSYIAKVLEKSKLADFLGEVSISVYLIHVPVISLFRNAYDLASFGTMQLIGLSVVIFLAAVIHYYGTRWLVTGVRTVKKYIQKAVAAS